MYVVKIINVNYIFYFDSKLKLYFYITKIIKFKRINFALHKI